MKTKLKIAVLLAGAVALGTLPFLLGGCQSVPPEFLYTPHTNVLSEVVIPVATNTVTVTNYVTRNVTVTNQLAAAADGTPRFEIVVQPVREGVVTSSTQVTYQTNQTLGVTYSLNTNAAGFAKAAGSITNVFAPGLGDLVSKGLLGLGALVGGLFAAKYKVQNGVVEREHATTKDNLEKTATSLSQSIQVYREIAQTTPQGALADQALKVWMGKHQQVNGVADIVARVLNEQVDDSAARELAQEVLAEAQRLRTATPNTATAVVGI